jgi:hypothetical protein
MNDLDLFAMCVEALYRGGEPHLVEAGAYLRAREMKAVIAASEVNSKGEHVCVVTGG